MWICFFIKSYFIFFSQVELMSWTFHRPANCISEPRVQRPLVGDHCNRVTFKLTLTCVSLSWGSRPGDTPRAGARRKCWGPLRRWQVLLRSFPVQRSRLKYRRWQCCWNCPAGAQRNLIFSIAMDTGITYPVCRQKWVHKDLWVKLCKHKELVLCFIIITLSFWWLPSGPVVCVFHSLTRAAHTAFCLELDSS